MKRLLIGALIFLAGCGQLSAIEGTPRAVLREYKVEAPYVWVFNLGTLGFLQYGRGETLSELIYLPGGQPYRIENIDVIRLWSDTSIIIVTDKVFLIEKDFPTRVEKIPGSNIKEEVCPSTTKDTP